MDEKIYKKICSIIMSENRWYLYDCQDEKISEPSSARIFSSAMNIRYRKNRNMSREDISTVWVLVGFRNDNKEWIQVGRTKNLTNLLDEIREDVKKFYGSGNKYASLREQHYEKLVFYEINIDNYLKKDILFKKIYGEVPQNEKFSLAYYFIRAAYVEGKLGAETSAYMYHESALDEYFYSYYKDL